MQKSPIIIKRDGSHQPFQPEKIALVSQAAGLEPDQANILATQVDKWVHKQPGNSVSSLQIRDQVIAGLKQMDPMAANMYQWYEQTKK